MILRALLLLCLAASCCAAAPATAASAREGAHTLLPKSFSGWQKTQSTLTINPALADAANGPMLKEYGFSDSETAIYAREGHKLQLRAARFADATGAYGAFSFYAQPAMQPIQLGDRGAASSDHLLFVRANVLVDALFDHSSAMSAAELRDLAQALPVAMGSAALPPNLPAYLPQQSLIANSTRYVVGPLGWAAIGAPLPAGMVDFSRSPEITVAQYRTSSGTATLGIVNYPTPQIALDRMRALSAAAGASLPPQKLQGTVTLSIEGKDATFRRTGPLLALVSGEISGGEAQSLVQSVNYDAQVTWNERPPVTKEKIGSLIVGIFVLIAILIAVFLILMLFFGGSFVLLRKLFPNQRFLPTQQEELIKLNLQD